MQLMRHSERDQGSKCYTKQTHCVRLLDTIADKSPIRTADDKLIVNFNKTLDLRVSISSAKWDPSTTWA
jgi:hypothetical protein